MQISTKTVYPCFCWINQKEHDILLVNLVNRKFTFYLEYSNKMNEHKNISWKEILWNYFGKFFLVSYVHKAWKLQLKLFTSKCYNITLKLLSQPGNSYLSQPGNSLKTLMFSLPYWLTKLTNVDSNPNNIYNAFAE